MYDIAKKAREKMKAKAKSLANPGNYAKDQKVDSADWSPAPPINAEAKTGLRPISGRTYKKGGKVEGKEVKARADRKPRATGGRTENMGTSFANRNMKEANEKREGVKHVGALKRGGKARATGGQVLSSAASKKDGIYDKKALGAIDPKPARAKAEHYKKGGKVNASGKVKKADGGGSWLEKIVGKPKTGSDLSQVGKDQTQRYSQEDKGALNRVISGDDSLPSPNEAAESAARTGDKRGGSVKRKAHAAGGKAEHPDVKEDKALVRKMVKKDALTGKKEGGEVGKKWIQSAIKKPGALHKSLGVPAGEKIPAKKLEKAAEKGGKLGKRARLAETLKRMNRAEGGGFSMLGAEKPKSRKGQAGKTDIHINVIAGQKPEPMATGMVPPRVPMPPMMPPAAGPMPSPAAPPPAGLPMARRAGGRISKVASSYRDMEAGSGSAEGRLQKTDIAKRHGDAPARRAGGKVRAK